MHSNILKLKPAEERKDGPENRSSNIPLEPFDKFNGNAVIALEKEDSVNEPEGQKERQGVNGASLSSSDRPGRDNLESLSDSLYDSFSSCGSQGSHDI